jgi:hypothetical protein
MSLVGKSNMGELFNSALDGVTSLSNTYFPTFALGCLICLAILGPCYIYLAIFGPEEATENYAH